jgi:hypothetical protein
MVRMTALKEENGELRCTYTLELLGHWFEVDGVLYYQLVNN